MRIVALAAIFLALAGLALNVWSVKRNLDTGFHYRIASPVPLTSHVTKVDLSPELERDGLRIAHFGDVFEWQDHLFVSKQRRLVVLAIESQGPAADLLYTLYDAGNSPVATGKLQAVTDADILVGGNNIMRNDDKRYVVYGPRGSSGWRATHVIIDDQIPMSTRAVIHR